MTTQFSTYKEMPVAKDTGVGTGSWLTRQAAGLFLCATLMCASGLIPGRVSAATDTYYFQNVASSSVCTGTSTINQSGEANVLPGGSLVNSDGARLVTNWYHFSWNAGAHQASSLADDMYTAPYTTPMTITALSLRMNYTVTEGYFNGTVYPNTYFYAKFFDVDGNAPCPSYEQGTLIAQSPTQNYPPTTTTTSVSGLMYNMLPGHRIRVELWDSTNFTGVAITFKYGPGSGVNPTGLTVTQTPTSPETNTVGPGTVLADTTIPPGGAQTALNTFTLQTSTGTDTVQNLTVNLSPAGSSSVIGAISVKNDDGSITYGTISNPASDLLYIPLSPAITATAAPVQYKIMVTPKTHAAMPAVPGASYPVQALVSRLGSLYTKVYSDTPSATVTIDNLSLGTPSGTVNPGDSTVVLNWTNPADADFHSMLILRGTAAITATPVEGSSYVVGNTLGGNKVVYAGAGETFTDGLVSGDYLWNGTPYYYRVFARDVNGNYSTGWTIGPITPVQSGAGTVVVGDGTNPSNSTVGIVSSGQVSLDAFTITSWPPSHLTSVSVTFPPGTASYLSQVYLTNASDTIIRNTTPTSDTVVLSGLNLTLSDVVSSFKIKIEQKPSSPPPAGTEAAITGVITAITLDNSNMNITYSDTASATVTYDHKAPANPVLQYANPADSNVNMRWTDPADADTYGTLILRNTVPVTDAPQDGTSYTSYSGNIGSSLLVHNSRFYTPLSVETLTWSSAVNGTTYYYKLFARDTRHNYSTGLSVGPVTPDVTVTVGNITEPVSAVIIAPGGSAASIDAFTLASTSSASVNSITVTLSTGALDVVGSVLITSDDGTTVYGSVVNPVAEVVTVPVAGLTATSPSSVYRIKIIPKAHVDMPSVPGAEVAVTGLVTAITTAASSYKVYNDTLSAIVTVENQSPGNPAGVAAITLDGGFNLRWANPPDADFSDILVLRNTTAIAEQPVEGASYSAGMTLGGSTVAFAGNGLSFIERGLTNGASYHYRLFARDSRGNYSAVGSPIGPLSPLPNDQTVAGVATATMQGFDAIVVNMPFTDDANGNGTCAVEYQLSSGGSWTPWLSGITRSTTACTTTITGLTAGTRYDVRMTYADSDGLLGTASQTATGIVALSLVQTTVGTVTAAFTDLSTITVTAPFSNDYNHDNSFLLEYKESSTSDWIAWGYYAGPSDSPYIMWIGGLPQLVPYDIRTTFSDPDGVNGTAVQTITSLVAPSTQNPKLIHNSLNAKWKPYWSEYGGWGVPGGQYGEFTCMTCHEQRSTNAAGIKSFINLMPIPGSMLPGSENFGGPVRFDGPGGAGSPYGFGDDTELSGGIPRVEDPLRINRICEVCHTLTQGSPANQPEAPEHRKNQDTPSNHNPPDCTNCHRHDNGFASPWSNPNP